jgi:hypothetical protein
MAVITEDGRLMTMGSEDHGKLGHTTVEVSAAQEKATRQTKLTGTGYRPKLA